MPENLPKAVLILLWLLIGTIIVGALTMKSSMLNVVIFILLFYGVPVAIYMLFKKKNTSKE